MELPRKSRRAAAVNHLDTMPGIRRKALIAWSSGKDSAWALHEARRAGDYDIVGALTTVTDDIRARQHAWRARGIAARAARGRRAAGAHRAHSLSVPERDLRARNGGGDRRGQSRAASRT